ncbi:MAG TPA: 50S ribosomal protein L24 [Candidatus Xenobia bacterium]
MARPNIEERQKRQVHVKKNDQVVVLSGKDKDKKGKVIEVLREKGRVVVENINLAKRHTKPRPGQHNGGIMEKPLALEASKVQLICPKCGKPTRIGKKATEVDKKTVFVRVCKHCNEEI